MQRILGHRRKAIQEFDMIKDGDRIAVGVSGGKDSLCLLAGLSLLRRFIGIDYSLTAITLDPMFYGQPGSYDAVNQLCMAHGIEYRLIRTHIGEIVFDIRKEPNPCSLCARLRRGALHDAAKEAGCNVVALGHHYNDVVETFMMNLFIEGRVGCFSPKSYLSRKELYMIRPLVFAPETAIRSAVKRLEVEVVKSVCPADGATKREEMKEFIKDMEHRDKGFTDRLFGALRRSGVDGWGFKDKKAGELSSE